MIHLIRALAICVLMTSAFGCVTAGEVRQLRQEVAAAEDRLRFCQQNTERAEERLMDLEHRLLNIRHGVVVDQPPAQAPCNNCVNPADTPQCARFCVINTEKLWDPKRPHPTEAACAQLKQERMTLANAQDMYLCQRDAYTESVVEMQEGRHEKTGDQ